MLRLFVLSVGAFVYASTADATPRFGVGGLQSAEKNSADRQASSQNGLVAFFAQFFSFEQNAKRVTASAPTAADQKQGSATVAKECDQPDDRAKAKSGESETKVAKQTGPEPLYLAF